jgi:hypothetical protein
MLLQRNSFNGNDCSKYRKNVDDFRHTFLMFPHQKKPCTNLIPMYVSYKRDVFSYKNYDFARFMRWRKNKLDHEKTSEITPVAKANL